MSSLTELIENYTIKFDYKVAQLVEPLTRISGITGFFYYTLAANGDFTYISNTPGWSEEYFFEKLYLQNPYLRHPRFVSPGTYFSYLVHDEEYLNDRKRQWSELIIDPAMLIIEPHHQEMVGYGLYSDNKNKNIYNFYFNEIPLIKSFVGYFKNEMKDILADMKFNCGNLKQAKKKLFLQPGNDQSSPLTASQRLKFFQELNLIEPYLKNVDLSNREKEIIKLYKLGRSAPEIAKSLFLSPRTVESYLNTLKLKLGCRKKSELFDRIHQMELLGYYF